MDSARSQRLTFVPSVVGLGTALIVLLFVFTTYMEDFDLQQLQVQQYYSYFLDVQVMVFIGFGFLMTFLRRYSYSAVALNFFVSCIVWLFALLCLGAAQQVWWNLKWTKIQLDIPLLINSSFCAASTMISFGAVIGKTTPTQLLWLLVLEVPLYAVNAHLVFDVFKAVDIGGSISIHIFGAYYGLAASLLVSRKQKNYGLSNTKNTSSYLNDVTSMIGTIFLWIYWPSFNGALASLPIGTTIDEATPYEKQAQFLCIVNTVLSLSGCCVAAFATSALVGNRFQMVHIQNATIAGGVAMGSAAALRMTPGGAVLVGAGAGVISTLGFQYLTPFLEEKIRLGDTCGVHNLHGMPGILAGMVAGFAAFGQSESFLAHNPNTQIVYQIYAILVTLGIAILGGVVIGWVVSTFNSVLGPDLSSEELFDDSAFWHNVQAELMPLPAPGSNLTSSHYWDKTNVLKADMTLYTINSAHNPDNRPAGGHCCHCSCNQNVNWDVAKAEAANNYSSVSRPSASTSCWSGTTPHAGANLAATSYAGTQGGMSKASSGNNLAATSYAGTLAAVSVNAPSGSNALAGNTDSASTSAGNTLHGATELATVTIQA